MTRYLIADVMLFDDELYEVCQLGVNTPSPVMLGAAASRCFSTLLDAKGAIVTKKELLHEGWERYGQQVSVNSVNQSVAQIRRCLSSIGHPDYVVTVPRIGYKICGGLAIEIIADVQVPQSTPVITVESTVTPLAVRCADEQVHVQHHHQRSVWGVCFSVLLLNMLLAFGWGVMQMSSPLATAIDFNYLPVSGTQDFHLFSTPGLNVSPERITAHLLKLKSSPPVFAALTSHSYVYLNGALRDDVYTYFLCREPIEVSRSGCTAYVVMGNEG